MKILNMGAILKNNSRPTIQKELNMNSNCITKIFSSNNLYSYEVAIS